MHEEPERIVRRFAAAGNLVVSGQLTAVVPDDPGLRGVLVRLGAVIAAPDEAQYVYADGDAGARVVAGQLRDGAIVIETGSAAAFHPGAAAEEATRMPFRAYRLADGRLVRVLPGGAARADASDPVGDADARIAWAKDFMPACAAESARLAASGVLRGKRFGISMVLEPKTATLALFLREAGAEVVLYAHADETDPAVAEALRLRGFTVHASTSPAAQLENARAFLAERIDVLLDDGSHLIRLAQLDGVALAGAAEETTSGLRPLRAMGDLLTVPVVAVNDARMKTRFDNRYGTGQSCVFAIADLLEPLGRTFDGSVTVVVGFGPVGAGVAQHAHALGAEVVLVEHDPVRALEARHAGYRTATLDAALQRADIVVSATGVAGTVPHGALAAAAGTHRDTVFAVAGGVIDEIELDAALAAGATLHPRAPKVDALQLRNGSVLLLDRGGCINITAAEGNPVQIMDYSFAMQLAAAELLAAGAYPRPGVHPLPAAADARVAAALVGTRAMPPVVDTPASWHPARFPDVPALREDPRDG